MKELDEITHFDKLRLLKISRAGCSEQELAQILVSHGDTLEKVKLGTINMLTLESWRWRENTKSPTVVPPDTV